MAIFSSLVLGAACFAYPSQALFVPPFLNLTSLAPAPTMPANTTGTPVVPPYLPTAPANNTNTTTTTTTVVLLPFPTDDSYPVIQAKARPEKIPDEPVMWFEENFTREICGKSTFENHVALSSPYKADCLALAEEVREDWKGRWVSRHFSDATTIMPLISYGTCTFGVRPAREEDLDQWHWVVSNLDMAPILETVAEEYTDAPEGAADVGADGIGDHMGASGIMGCQSGDRRTDLVWSIYNSDLEDPSWMNITRPADFEDDAGQTDVSLWLLLIAFVFGVIVVLS